MKTIFIPDSSILKNLFGNFSQNSQKSRKLEYFFKNNGENIVILDFMLNELHSKIFHKKIDYTNYKLWFNLHIAAYDKLYALLIKRKVKFEDMDSNSNNLNIIKIANLILSKNSSIIGFINKNNKNLKYQVNTVNDTYDFKFFTYTSSIIFSYVILYALNNKDKDIVFLINNPILKKLENYFIENKVNLSGMKNFKWPDNLEVKLLKDL